MSSNKKQKALPDWEKNVQQCTKALKMIMKNPAAGAFLMPVDWKALDLPLKMAVLAAVAQMAAVLVTFLVVVIAVVSRGNPQRRTSLVMVLCFTKHQSRHQRSVVPLARGAFAAEGVRIVAVLTEIAIGAKKAVEAWCD